MTSAGAGAHLHPDKPGKERMLFSVSIEWVPEPKLTHTAVEADDGRGLISDLYVFSFDGYFLVCLVFLFVFCFCFFVFFILFFFI